MDCIYSLAANAIAKKSVEKKILTENLNFNKELRAINKQKFVNQEDITKAIDALIKKITLHNVQYSINKQHKDELTFYTATATITLLENATLNYIEHNSCYFIGTNADFNELTSKYVILRYKDQNKSIENMGFRFLKLKDPLKIYL